MPAVTSTEQLVDGGLYIFTGTAKSSDGEIFTNLVCQALYGKMHMALYKDSSHVIAFNPETEDFDIIAKKGSMVLSDFSKQAPFLSWVSATIITELPTKETTVGKIVPTEEVSGLNFLNSYKDELTDI